MVSGSYITEALVVSNTSRTYPVSSHFEKEPIGQCVLFKRILLQITHPFTIIKGVCSLYWLLGVNL